MFDRYVVFTSHSIERLRECQLSLSKASWLIYTSEPNERTKEIRKYQREKYSDRAMYRRNGTYLFTLLPTQDKNTGDEIYLVLTVYDQRMDIR